MDYVSYLEKQLDPLLAADIALLSMAIFSDGIRHILIPHVVAIVTSERDLTLRVVVQGPSGEHVPASVTLDEGTGPIGGRRVKIELDALLKKIGQSGGENAVEVARALFDGAREFGADVIPCAASASVRVKDPNSGNRSTLFVVTKKATFYVNWLDRWTENANVSPEVAETYEGCLAKIIGKSPRGEPGVPLADMGKHINQVRDAIRTAVNELRHTE